MKYLRIFLCLVALSLSACMSHLFTDTSTRLQVENKTDVTILGVDIISEDGTSVQPWIRDAIEPGEKSKVVEEDWVGTFKVRVRFDKWNGETLVSIAKFCATYSTPIRVYNTLAKQGEPNVIEKNISGCGSEENVHMIYTETDLDFDGGSQHLIVSQDEDGNVAFKLK
ncbi:putative lipoprotein [Fibrobacter succinogenes subsp. succinogenes S85]|uniref:Putative lipoprotein n=1 Tax=Fibrobacter succinogenes (strain ATCC 19169 / S85) TaxID=59374 RepID=C9RN50_FIBSS|nr:hypothetical protein [Fibrobacter succinogenes]ACX76302.1 hypothetical protein Fisuc_2719 [Fibrobacter succinogenes subsp. succinogenes S85]ADL24733.1 putative lipoprotein [Fibrobacter succinogenes subsp. succinogenes S85]